MTTTTAPETKSISLIESAVARFKAWATKPAIKTADEYRIAGETLKQIKEAQTKVDEFFDDNISEAYSLHKRLTGQKKVFTEVLKLAYDNLKNARVEFSDEQERLRKAEQDRLDAEAREKERKEKEKLEKAAQKAEAKGDTSKAEELREKKDQVIVHTPQAAPRVEKTEGVSQRKKWVAEVTDMMALARAVADGKIPVAVLEVKQSKLDAHADLVRNTVTIEGVRFFEKTIETVR